MHPSRSSDAVGWAPCSENLTPAMLFFAVFALIALVFCCHLTPIRFSMPCRCGDHPALLRACQSGRQVVPVFILDDDLHGPGACSSAAVLGAAAALRQQLQSLGSNLVFRRGSSAQELKAIVDEVGASCVVAQDDVEHAWVSCERARSTDILSPSAGDVTAPIYAGRSDLEGRV